MAEKKDVEKSINELNKGQLADEQYGDEDFQKQQAELFEVVYGTKPGTVEGESSEENQSSDNKSEESADEINQQTDSNDDSTSDDKSQSSEQSKGEKPKEEKFSEPNYEQLYNDSLSKIQELEGKISGLNQQLQSAAAVNSLINDLGLKDANQERVETVISGIRQVADDLQNVPALGKVINRFYSGELQPEMEEEKIPQDFMPDGMVYSESDAYQDKSSDSYRAYKAFRSWELSSQQKKQEFLVRIEEERKSGNGVSEGFQTALKQLVEGFNTTRVDLVNQFPITDGVWKDFIEFYRSGNPLTIKAAFAVFAKEKGIKSTVAKKLEENNKKVGSVIDSKTKKDEFYSEGDAVPQTDHDKQQKEYMEELGWYNN
jgi:hypothetical protein